MPKTRSTATLPSNSAKGSQPKKATRQLKAQAGQDTPEVPLLSAPVNSPRRKAKAVSPACPVEVPTHLSATAPASTEQALEPPSDRSVRQEILDVLKESLRVQVEDGDFTDPNTRILKLYLDNKCISNTRFSVRSRREYEG